MHVVISSSLYLTPQPLSRTWPSSPPLFFSSLILTVNWWLLRGVKQDLKLVRQDMFEIALNKCTVLLSTAGLEENIPTIEALIWAQGATTAAAAAAALSGWCRKPVDYHPLLVCADTALALGPPMGEEKLPRRFINF